MNKQKQEKSTQKLALLFVLHVTLDVKNVFADHDETGASNEIYANRQHNNLIKLN